MIGFALINPETILVQIRVELRFALFLLGQPRQKEGGLSWVEPWLFSNLLLFVITVDSTRNAFQDSTRVEYAHLDCYCFCQRLLAGYFGQTVSWFCFFWSTTVSRFVCLTPNGTWWLGLLSALFSSIDWYIFWIENSNIDFDPKIKQ